MIAAWIGWLATALNSVIAIPQALRIIRVKAIEGVSVAAWQAIWWSGAAWTWYGFATGRLQLIVCNIPMTVTTAMVLALIARHSTMSLVRLAIPPLVGAAVAVILFRAFGDLAFALAMSGPSLGSRVAQLLTAIRALNTQALSPPTLAIGAAAQTLWAIYGAQTGSLAIVALNIPGALLQASSLSVAIVRQHRSREAPAARVDRVVSEGEAQPWPTA